MVKFALKVQAEHLEEVAEYMGCEPLFMADLAMLQDADAAEEVREQAEERVMAANRQYGEMLGHGDQLTVERWQDVRQILSQEVTAFGRLEFCGPFRLEGLHSHMKKTKIDYKALMPDMTNFDDEICLAQLAARAGKGDMLSNEEKKIVKNDSSYERHKQFAEEVGTTYGLNLFDNYDNKNPEKLDAVVNEKSAVQFVLEMFDNFDVTANLFYNPAIHDAKQARDGCDKEGEDDMFAYCREGFIR
jgi:hypothetical protein